jgi:hypothetical protein
VQINQRPVAIGFDLVGLILSAIAAIILAPLLEKILAALWKAFVKIKDLLS